MASSSKLVLLQISSCVCWITIQKAASRHSTLCSTTSSRRQQTKELTPVHRHPRPPPWTTPIQPPLPALCLAPVRARQAVSIAAAAAAQFSSTTVVASPACVCSPGGSSGSSNDNRNYRYSNRYYNSAVTHSDYEMTSPQVNAPTPRSSRCQDNEVSRD